MKSRARHHSAAGFTLLEMAMVLVIIGVVMSAVMVGNDVLRHAKGQKAFSNFVVPWRDVFAQFAQVTGSVPDARNAVLPTHLVNGAVNTPLCGTDMTNRFLEVGIRVPPGNGNGLEDQYLYQDSSGTPQRLTICFVTLSNWSAQGTTTANFVPQNRHVMRITGLTAELAAQMDVLVDGNLSARFGQFRMNIAHAANNATEVSWPLPDTNGGAQPQVTAYLEMF